MQKQRWSANIPAADVREGLNGAVYAGDEHRRQAALPPSSPRLSGALGRGGRLGEAVTRRSRKGGDGGMRKKTNPV